MEDDADTGCDVLADVPLEEDPLQEQEMAEPLIDQDIGSSRILLIHKKSTIVNVGTGTSAGPQAAVIAMQCTFQPGPYVRFNSAQVRISLKPKCNILDIWPKSVAAREDMKFTRNRSSGMSGGVSIPLVKVSGEFKLSEMVECKQSAVLLTGSGEGSETALWSYGEEKELGVGIAFESVLLLLVRCEGASSQKATLEVDASVLRNGWPSVSARRLNSITEIQMAIPFP